MTDEVVNAFVDGSELAVLVREGGRVVARRVKPEYSFFVRNEDLDDEFARSLRQSRSLLAMKKEGAFTRLCWADDWVRRSMLHGRKDGQERIPSPFQDRAIQTYEGDVDPVRRWFTDTGTGVAKPRRGYYDLETDSRVGPKEAKKGRARVVAWALCGEGGEKLKVGLLRDWTDEAEEELVRAFFEAAEEYDQLGAWSGDDFDRPVLEGRINWLGLRIDLRRWLWLDLLKMFRRMNLNSAESGAEKRSMKLQSIAMATIGEGKEEVPDWVAERWPARSLGSLTFDLWDSGEEGRALLRKYVAQDTMLLPKIEAETGFGALFDTLCDVCRVLPDSRGLLPTQQMDGFMLRLGAERDYRFATREWREDQPDHDPFAGAFCMEPKAKGISRDVHVADFASLYPSIIQTWNMSPETKARDMPVNGPIPSGFCRSPKTGIGFRTDVEGILPIALREMIRLRKYWSELAAKLPPGTPEAKEAQRRSMAYKVAANSFYGVVGSPYSRFYDRQVAESVTQNGVWLIQQTIAAAEERGFRVVYGDTDSFFAVGCSETEMEEFVGWCNRELYPALLEKVGCRPEQRAIKIAYEKAFDRIVMVTKKRYAGVYLHYKGTRAKPLPAEGEEYDKKRHSRPEIKGLEFKRGDAALLASRLQERVIMDLMHGIDRPEVYRRHLETTLAHVQTDQLPLDEVSLSKSLSKKPADYHRKTSTGKDAAVPPHVKVAEMLEASGRPIGEGARVTYVVVDGSDGIEAIPAEDYRGECDRYYLWENLVYPPTQRVLQAAFPDQDWVTGLERTRPKKERPPKKEKLPAREQRAVDSGQGSLFAASPARDEASVDAALEAEAWEIMLREIQRRNAWRE